MEHNSQVRPTSVGNASRPRDVRPVGLLRIALQKRTRAPRLRTPLALAGALALLAGCGSGGPTEGSDLSTPAREITAVAGCGPESYTDPELLDHEVARCEPNTPAPEKLAERTSITVSAATLSSEHMAPLLLAKSLGEFEKENLDVEFKVLSASDAWPLLGRGELDVVWGGTEAAMFNAIASDFHIRQVSGNFIPVETSKAGLWSSTNGKVDPDDPKISALKGGTVASIAGPGGVINYPLSEALKKEGLSINDIKIQTLPAADVLTSLRNGSVDGAWVLDPLWQELEQEPKTAHLAGQPKGEVLGGAFMGPNLLAENKDAGVAFLRALIRTINTHFTGDYHQDAELMAEVRRETELKAEQLAKSPALLFDWEIRAGTATRIQEVFLTTRAVSYTEPMPEDQVVDRSLYQEVVGRSG